MKKIEMTDLRLDGDTVPGGWHAYVPEVQPDEEWLAHAERYFVADGYTPAQARQIARTVVQSKMDFGWVDGLRKSIRRYASIYRRRFGDLEGFNPERMQVAYMPGENTGRRGKAFVNQLFREMRNAS